MQPRNGLLKEVTVLKRAASKSACSMVLWTWGRRSDFIGKLVALWLPGIRLLCSLRDTDKKKVRRLRWLERFAHRLVTGYVSNSQLSVDLLSQIVPRVRERAFILLNALDDEDVLQDLVAMPAERPKRVQVLLLGNLRIGKKGVDLAVELARRVKSHQLPFEFRLAGGGRPSEQRKLAKLIRQTNVGDIFHYEGEALDPVSFLRSGHVFFLPSRYEGLPNVLLEALNLGLPCVASRVGDIESLATDGTHLWLFRVGDVSQMFNVFKAIADDWSAAMSVAESGREFCRRTFSRAKMKERLGQILRQIAVRNE
ncbi:MAG: glycosyltransferase family 4 protein [Verrucomicrobia bacterium]|nr:glycosyltransferase family 4 protein [Verrucomicrobiota bacterium]